MPDMEFDPLSLFTPSPSTEQEEILIESKLVTGTESNSFILKPVTDSTQDTEDEYLLPLHPLDLPLLKLQPPYEVLITILKLFSPNEVLNFNVEESCTQNSNPNVIFTEKCVDEQTLSSAKNWLSHNTPRFNTTKKLAYIPNLADPFKKTYSKEYNAYFTRLISLPLHWITNDDISEIQKLASLRISENCGRTAQPEIIRKISINNLNKLLTKNNGYILLKEPSLTNDNLGFKTWGSSLILANRLLNNNKNYLRNKVLELGSGTGLVGMICSLLGFETLLTDLPEIVSNLQENIKLNCINSEAYPLDWTNPSSFVDKYGDVKYDTIVISDPIYSPQHPYWVVNMINKFFSGKNHARVLIQIPLRPQFESERQLLWDLLEKSNYKLQEHEIEDGFDDFGEMQFCFKLYSKSYK